MVRTEYRAGTPGSLWGIRKEDQTELEPERKKEISIKPRLRDSSQGDQIDEKYFPSYGEQILSLISLVPELLVS